MKDPVKTLRTLLRIRERRGESIERELAQARARLALAEEEVLEAQARQAACESAQSSGQARLDQCMRKTFSLDAQRSLELLLADLRAATSQAGCALQERRAATQRLQPAVDEAQAALRRHEQRLRCLRDQLAKALTRRDAMVEELAEEEAEEAAAGRYAMRLRAGRMESLHG